MNRLKMFGLKFNLQNNGPIGANVQITRKADWHRMAVKRCIKLHLVQVKQHSLVCRYSLRYFASETFAASLYITIYSIMFTMIKR